MGDALHKDLSGNERNYEDKGAPDDNISKIQQKMQDDKFKGLDGKRANQIKVLNITLGRQNEIGRHQKIVNSTSSQGNLQKNHNFSQFHQKVGKLFWISFRHKQARGFKKPNILSQTRS